ncbi:potassium channel family protein [Chitinophaga japonensis]|uniref:Trk system potassium uptake protein TrkA n=1 Tax=Chitinophaga japonensis TaxID=104662 RepID=A0A562SYJ0_CHIJA|nr:TrkA family potassium uptake protein [Chitinophaga japonensis]TWI86397.1 trk system potassium uptake protein TrkA [Chitinophaga japonensis]
MKFIVFGLGNFGAALSQQLVSLGHEVIGVDLKQELVDKYSSSITHTITLDATHREGMQQLPLHDTDAAIVGIGENEGITIMVTALLKQIGVKRIICRVTSPLQQIVLEAMRIEEFVYPEASSAERLAFKLDLPGVLNSYRFRDDYRLLEVQVPERYVNKTVESIRFAEKYRLVLVTITRDEHGKNIFGSESAVPHAMGPVKPDTVLLPDDTLLIFGTAHDLQSFVD